MEIKVLKTNAEHQLALDELERLIDLDPDSGEKEADRLELLALLIEDYEEKHFPIDLPDPIDALEFVMDQHGFTQKDLIPFIGSRSKVSEVLSGKRPLSISMIRALHKGLNIPPEILIQKTDEALDESAEIDWNRYPLKEMKKLRWIEATSKKIETNAEELVKAFFKPIGGIQEVPMFLRQSLHVLRSARKMNAHSLEAWRGQILRRAISQAIPNYNPSMISMDFLRDIARLSRSEKGPLMARDYLNAYGITLVIQEHLSKTYLDGAAFRAPNGKPVIGMTLRYDRVDNFWFVLMHELVHVWKHLTEKTIAFFDDLDPTPEVADYEDEADKVAQEALIPASVWETSGARYLQSSEAVQALAEELRIHPAIVAGRIRNDTKNFRKLNHLVGHREVRKLFGI